MIEGLKRGQMAALPPQPETAIEEFKGSYITVKRANVREKPLAEARLVKALEPGVSLKVTGRVKDTGWFRVASLDNKVRGFLPGDAIQDLTAAEETDWQRAKDAKQSAVVADFLRRYPAGTHSEEAKILHDALLKNEEAARRQKTEEADWQRVKDAKQSSVVSGFLRRYPTGAYAEQAKNLRDALVKDEEAVQRQKAEETERRKTEEAAQRQKADEAALKARQEATRRQNIAEADQRKTDSPTASNAADAESSRPQQQAMIAPSSKAIASPTASPGAHDGAWKGQALLSYGPVSCPFYFAITVTNNVLTGTAHFENRYNKPTFDVSGEIAHDGTVNAKVGSHNLVGKFTSNEFKGTVAGFRCAHGEQDASVNLSPVR